MVKSWLKLFRVVNIPTVPGDVFVGAAAVSAFSTAQTAPLPGAVCAAAAASVCIYLFGLVDNDIVGSRHDSGRPIPDGEISLASARVARFLCLLTATVIAAAADLPRFWWMFAFILLCQIFNYNRVKNSLLMGCCRGFNVLAGAAACGMSGANGATAAAVVFALIWTAYITAVTKYSEGEDADPERKRQVGFFIGAIVYLQLTALLVCFLLRPVAMTRDLLVAGAAMLVMLRLFKRVFPKVSAS